MNLQLIFKSVLNMSLTGSVVICFVLIVRMLLKKAPKMFSYALWAVVLFRLLCPVSFTSAFSLLGFTRATVSEPESVVTSVEYAPVQDIYQHKQENTEAEQAEPDHDYELPEVHPEQSIPENRTEVTQTPDAVSQQAPAEPVRDPIYYAVMIWLVGMGVMLIYNVCSYHKLGKKIVGAVRLRKNIYLADHIPSPFVMGILRPKIYLPSALEPSERRYIIAHERYHIRRKDHIIKLLAYIALCIHWFNPLVWVAFAMSGKDMEMSCDEAVIRMFGLDIRAEYSASLLRLATDHRIIAGTPLAFGEGDTKGRVLNMAKWKKPNFWVVICAAIVCIGVLAACAMNPAETIPQSDTVSTIPTETNLQEDAGWGVYIKPDRVSRTGATALFVYSGSVPGEEGAELTYGDFLSLDRMENGSWVPVEELSGFDYYVGDSSYPVVDGYGMVHEWPDRFGELPDGHYRLGKQVVLVRADGSTENRMVYGEFSLPGSVRTGLIPLEELPERYSAEQAMIDGCFVTEDGAARENKELFQDFAVSSWNGMPGVIRIVNWHYGEDSKCSVMDLSFDGNVYTLTSLENTYTFRYLKQFTGEKAWEGAGHDAFEYYVLVNDDTVTWEEIHTGILDVTAPENPEHWTVYANFVYLPKRPQLPMNPAQAVLEFNGEPLVTVTDFDRLEKIWILFEEAELLGYEPKTHSIGVGLNLILTSKNGETVTIELDPDSDLCRINGEYVFYGAYDEPDYIEKLWYYLGIPSWPDSVYEKYPNALRP